MMCDLCRGVAGGRRVVLCGALDDSTLCYYLALDDMLYYLLIPRIKGKCTLLEVSYVEHAPTPLVPGASSVL